LTIVKGAADRSATGDASAAAEPSELDWSILMARAQAGDAAAYRRLLEEITPYLRSLAARYHNDRSDIEDAVQDTLLTLHAIRYTYDATRPFGPWLVAIANRRLVDRLRRQSRLRARETPLAPAHETFPEHRTNLEGELSDRFEVEAAIQKLAPGEQHAIRLLKLKEMSLKEAAAASGMSIGALKAATYRAVKNLKNVLSRSEDK
jgi:RNA polymerase sigma-70 factor (ECF subfamily)